MLNTAASSDAGKYRIVQSTAHFRKITRRAEMENKLQESLKDIEDDDKK